MSNGDPSGSGGPRPPEKLDVLCKAVDKGIAYFSGQETSPDVGNVALMLTGNSEYFHVGERFTVTFTPQ